MAFHINKFAAISLSPRMAIFKSNDFLLFLSIPVCLLIFQTKMSSHESPAVYVPLLAEGFVCVRSEWHGTESSISWSGVPGIVGALY